MGGYGGASGKTKDKCYRDTGGNKVKDKNAIEVAEYYIKSGKYVACLQEKPPKNRADLSVDGVHVEVKGLSTLSPNTVESKLRHAHKQIHGEDDRYNIETHRQGKIIILSRHDNKIEKSTIISKMREGVSIAMKKGYLDEKVELWIGKDIYQLN